LEALRHLGWGLGKEDEVQTRPLLLPTAAQDDGKTLGIQRRHLPPKGVPRGGGDGGREPRGLLEGVALLQRGAPLARHPSTGGRWRPTRLAACQHSRTGCWGGWRATVAMGPRRFVPCLTKTAAAPFFLPGGAGTA
jgi:hypothetical protein